MHDRHVTPSKRGANDIPAEAPNNPRSMGEVALLSLIAAFNPSLLAATTTVILLLPRPERLMFGYWIGAILMGVVSGLVIVFALSGTSAGQTTKKTVSPAVDLALAALALIGVLALAAGRTKPSKARRTKRKNGNKTPKWQ